MPTPRPSDIYQLVCDKTVAELERLVKKGAPNSPQAETTHEEREVSDAQFAQDEEVSVDELERLAAQNPYDGENEQEDDEVSDAQLAQW